MESGKWKILQIHAAFLSLCSLRINTTFYNFTQTQNKHTATIRHAARMQGDFGCRAPDGEAAALLQPELTRSDSGLMCQPPTPSPRQSQAHNASRAQSCGSVWQLGC